MNQTTNIAHTTVVRRLSAVALTLILTAFVGLAPPATAKASDHTPLVEGESAVAAIFIADEPTPAARLAAIEVQFAVEKMTGVTLPIHHAAQAPAEIKTRILIGDQPQTRELGLVGSDFGHVEYLCRVEPGRIILLGQDKPTSVGVTVNFNQLVAREGSLSVQLPGMYEPQGSLRAAYHFLESLGVRYYGPRPHHSIYPSSKRLSAKPADVRREPVIKYTNGLSSDTTHGVFWPIQRILYDLPINEEVLLFARRLRTGGKEWSVVNHSLTPMRLRERFGPPPGGPSDIHEQHLPEIFPPPGSPAHQPCFSSSRLAEIMAADAAAYFDGELAAKPYGAHGDQDSFHIVPNDAYGFCTCETCTASYATYAKPGNPGAFGSGDYSDNFFGFLNKVAKPLSKTHPDKFISTLAYEGYFWPPKDVELEPNILVTPCIITCDHWKRIQRKNDMDAYESWIQRAKKLDHPIYLWNYFHHPEEIGVTRSHKVFPQFSPMHIHQLARRYERDNVEGIFLCGWGEGLDFYVMMKCFDDPGVDLNALIDEYFTLSLGKEAGFYVKRFYKQIEAISMRPMNGPVHVDERFFWEEQGDQRTLDRLERLLDRAEPLLPDDGARQRFGAWRALMEYMKQGRAEWLAKQVKP